MRPSTRNILSQVRLIGGVVALAAILWVFIEPTIQSPIDIREVLMTLFGLPAGAAALALQIDRKSEI